MQVGAIEMQVVNSTSQRRRRERRIKRRAPKKSAQDSNVFTNNEEILNRIANLPQQTITDNPLIDQFFNGSLFY